jgi:hypothetical protein
MVRSVVEISAERREGGWGRERRERENDAVI